MVAAGFLDGRFGASVGAPPLLEASMVAGTEGVVDKVLLAHVRNSPVFDGGGLSD